jgi:GT2 family glycosyltransferase
MTAGDAELSVIIVNFNAGGFLLRCVEAVLASGISVQIIVSDNASTDDSLGLLRERFSGDARLVIVENRSNFGFAGGNNRAVDEASAPYLLFLNPDCIVGGGNLAVIPDPWIGLARLLYFERLWPGLLAGKRLDRTNDPLPRNPIEVEAISGAFMMVRREALDDVGLMDEEYFLHCEDLDWFVRFRRAGWHIYLVPDADAVHYKGVCSVGRPMSVLWHKHRGMVRFFRKFQFRDYPLPLSFLVIVGIWLHFGLVAPAAWIRRQLGRWTA